MTPSQLRVFLAVAETLSLRAAAKRLTLSQPAVTKSIRELERQLGVALLTRHAQGITLTECGHAFRHHATALVEEMRRTREDMLAISEGGVARIVIGVSSAMALTVLPSALERLHALSPSVRVHVVDAAMPQALDLLRDGTADLLLVHSIDDWVSAEFRGIPFFTSEMVACASAHSPYAGARSLAETLDAQWVYPNDVLNSFDTFFTRHGCEPPRRVVRSQSFTAGVALLMAGASIAFVLERVIGSVMQPLGLQRLDLAERFAHATGMAILRSDTVPTRAVQHLLSCLAQMPSQPA